MEISKQLNKSKSFDTIYLGSYYFNNKFMKTEFKEKFSLLLSSNYNNNI